MSKPTPKRWLTQPILEFEGANMSGARLLKYMMLSNLPGAEGDKYTRKYNQLAAKRQFSNAVKQASGKICIDLGANLGDYTLNMAQTAKKVYAFEPDPWTCDALRENLSGLANVEIVEAAAGTSEGSVSLFRHQEFEKNRTLNSQSSSVIAAKSNISSQNAVVVRQIDFLSFIRDLNEDICVLKIDIEGAEVDLLEALLDDVNLLERIQNVFAETHESRIPGHASRVEDLRRRVLGLKQTKINLYWE